MTNTAPALSSQLPQLELLALAGTGAFAEVWQVRDVRTGSLYALKQLRADRAQQSAVRRILANEAEVGSKVQSEFVVKACRLIDDISPPCLLLEWLSGQTLETLLESRRQLFCREALWIARQCAQGMHALLAAGFTHSDIKPSNIFVCHGGAVKLIDLGFARRETYAGIDLDHATDSYLTGTPEYLAPESLVPGSGGGSARDVYSLGVTIYRMLTGRLPFQGETVTEVVRQQQQAMPVDLRALTPAVPREVAALVHRLLSKQPLRRGGGLDWLIRELIALELSQMH